MARAGGHRLEVGHDLPIKNHWLLLFLNVRCTNIMIDCGIIKSINALYTHVLKASSLTSFCRYMCRAERGVKVRSAELSIRRPIINIQCCRHHSLEFNWNRSATSVEICQKWELSSLFCCCFSLSFSLYQSEIKTRRLEEHGVSFLSSFSPYLRSQIVLKGSIYFQLIFNVVCLLCLRVNGVVQYYAHIWLHMYSTEHWSKHLSQ